MTRCIVANGYFELAVLGIHVLDRVPFRASWFMSICLFIICFKSIDFCAQRSAAGDALASFACAWMVLARTMRGLGWLFLCCSSCFACEYFCFVQVCKQALAHHTVNDGG